VEQNNASIPPFPLLEKVEPNPLLEKVEQKAPNERVTSV
jgi:hypothetical protein